MVITRNILSIKDRLNKLFLLFSSVAFILGCIAVIFLLTNYNKEQITNNAHQWAKVISQQSIKDLLENNKQHLNDSLQVLTDVNNLNYIYIYRLESNKQKNKNVPLKIFSSYKKGANVFIPPDNLAQLQALKKVKYSDNYVELVYPIKNNQNIIGYIYLQFDCQKSNQNIFNIAITILLIALVVLLIAYAIVNRLLQKVIDALTLLNNNIFHIAKCKNFSLRCEKMPYREIDMLAQHVNLILQRAEKYIVKHEEDEQQFIQLNKSLEDKVNQRTDALKESNQELLSALETLHQYQGQLVESEKMASLGDMVAGVAHEVNTPIGLGVTSSSLLYDRLIEIKQAFENKTLKSSQLKKFLIDGEENLNIIMRNLSRAADLITSFKQVAVDQSSSEERRFNFKGLINEAILTLQPQLKNTRYTIEIDCPDNLIVTSKPGPINQILVNLIMNSIIHGFENQGFGNIKISIMDLSSQLHIHYQDNGRGINNEIKSKIFEPFITTKRGSGGSGLGMHLVYNLITQALNGTISFESETDKGVVFDINFPIENKNSKETNTNS
jgi:signal transduction histidine kinase